MRKAFSTDRATLWHGDCAHIASVIAPESIDAIVTDPPAGISFMGKAWDDDKGGPRRYERLAAAGMCRRACGTPVVPGFASCARCIEADKVAAGLRMGGAA
jgi:DNA modification methylase